MKKNYTHFPFADQENSDKDRLANGGLHSLKSGILAHCTPLVRASLRSWF